MELLARPRVVDLVRRDRIVDEGDRTVELHLEEAWPGRILAHVLGVVVEIHAGRAGLQRRDQRRVARQHSDLTGGARNDQELRLALERWSVRRHQRDVELLPVRHSYETAAGSGSASRSATATSSGDSPCSAGCWSSSPESLRPFSTAFSIVPTM